MLLSLRFPSHFLAMLVLVFCARLHAQDLVNGLGGAAGFGEGVMAAGDDISQRVDISSVFPNGLTFFGRTYTSLYVNNNGNITFDAPMASPFNPSQITAATQRLIAPFFADVDTTGGTNLTPTPGGTSTGANRVYYDLDAAAGIFTVTWDDVGYFAGHTDKLNAFQCRLKRRANGGFTMEFIYEAIKWTTGDVGGTNGFGGPIARAGYSGDDGTHFGEIPGSGDQTAMLALPTTFVTNSISFIVNPDGTVGDNLAPVAYASFINARQTTGPVSPRLFSNLNIQDPEGDAITFLREDPVTATNLIAFPTAPTTFATTLGGTVVVVDNVVSPPLLSYTPPGGVAVPFTDTFRFGGKDTFNHASAHATFSFLVDANRAPVGTDQTMEVYANETNAIALSATDPNDDPLTFTVTSIPTHGSLTGTAPFMVYTPDAGFTGADALTFTVNDGLLTSATASLTINVVSRRSITITSPNGGEAPFAKNQNIVITWNTTGLLNNLTFHYSADGGRNWLLLKDAVDPTLGSLTVLAPDVDSSLVMLSVADQRGSPSDITNSPITIGNPGANDDNKGCGAGSGSGMVLSFLLLGGLYLRRNLRAA